MEISSVLMFFLCTFLLTVSYPSIYTLIAMLTSNKAISSIICVSIAFIFIFVGGFLNGQLQKTQVPGNAYMVNSQDTVADKVQQDQNILHDSQNNIYMIQGTKRKIYHFLYDFIPGGQAVQLFMSYKIPWQLGLYSVIMAVGATGFGLLFFNKKDLK